MDRCVCVCVCGGGGLYLKLDDRICKIAKVPYNF